MNVLGAFPKEVHDVPISLECPQSLGVVVVNTEHQNVKKCSNFLRTQLESGPLARNNTYLRDLHNYKISCTNHDFFQGNE